MSTWTKQKLGTIGKVVTGKTPPTNQYELYGENFPFITPTDISDSSVYVKQPERCLSDAGARYLKSSRLPRGSVCYTCIASIGKIAMTLFDSFTNQQINSVIVDSTKHNNWFLFYLLKYKTPVIKLMAGGVASPIVNKTSFENLELEIPNLPTQAHIASVLSAYDDLIENNEMRIKALEEMAQLLYTECFVKSEKRLEMTELGKKIEIKKGKNITLNTITHGNVPVVAGGLSPAYYHNKANTSAPVITISASGANAGFVNLYYENIWASDCSFIDDNTTLFPYFYYLFLKNNQDEITRAQRGSAQPHVYPADLMRLKIANIPDDLLKKFENKIQVIFNIISILKKENKNLFQTRDLLIPQLVTGKRGLK